MGNIAIQLFQRNVFTFGKKNEVSDKYITQDNIKAITDLHGITHPCMPILTELTHRFGASRIRSIRVIRGQKTT